MRPGGTSPSTKGAPVDLNDPRPGHYRRRLVKGGPMVPARIWIIDGDRDPDTGELTSDQKVCCVVWFEDGPREVDAWEHWSFLAGNPISKADFDSMVATTDWARGTTAPEGSPREAVDLRRAAPIF